MLRALAALAVAAFAAGCATAPLPSTDDLPPHLTAPDPWPAVRAAMEGVPCEAAVGGTGDDSENLRLLANLTMGSGIHAELDLGAGLAVQARYSDGGFEVYDIRDPLRPVALAAFTDAPGALDVKFGPDNATVFVGLGDGIAIADVSDPTAPVATGMYSWDDLPAPPEGPMQVANANAHMLATARIGASDWLFVAPNAQTGVWVFAIEGEVGARTLRYVAQTLPAEGGPLGPHDIFVHEDPLDGHWYLYSADGFHGWTVFDVDDPTAPVPAGGLVNPAEGSYTHTIQAGVVEGRRLVATIGEVGANVLRIYDATVLAAPVLLAVWHSGDSPVAPQHNLNIAGTGLYVAHYGQGLYVFDLTDALTAGLGVPLAGTASLAPRAHWAAQESPGLQGPLDFDGFWDVVLQDGVLYVSHISEGLVVLGYGCNQLPDPTLTTTG
jgi:hypothetical protein